MKLKKRQQPMCSNCNLRAIVKRISSIEVKSFFLPIRASSDGNAISVLFFFNRERFLNDCILGSAASFLSVSAFLDDVILVSSDGGVCEEIQPHTDIKQKQKL